jgi:uncharacterized surface protein with fasciclin (FAS1) repeats
MGTTLEKLMQDKKLLRKILEFHIVPDMAAKAKDLKDGEELKTALKGEKLIIDAASQKGKVVVKGEDSTAEVTKADITAAMSVVHIIDNVLVPAQPSVIAY